MNKKLLFVFNPHSGKAQIKNHLLDIVDTFTKAGYDATLRPTQKRLDAYNYIKAHGSEYDRIVVSGGDGTLNEAVKGLINFDTADRRSLGYIPAGTTNDFASTLNIPKNMPEAADIAVNGTEFQCDIGRFNDKTFNYVAAFGAFTDVSYDTPQITKNALGHMAYVFEGIKRLSNLSSYHVNIKYDDGEIDDEVFLCMILNATSVAGIHTAGKRFNVDLNDGLFEMLVFRRPTNLIELQSIMTGLMKGEESRDGYSVIKSSRFEFTSDDNIKWTIDGEYGGNPSHAVIEVLRSAVTFIVDPNKIEKLAEE